MTAKVLYNTVLTPIGKELKNQSKTAIIRNSLMYVKKECISPTSFFLLEAECVSQDQGWVL